LNEEKKQQVIAFGRLGWSLRRIQRNTGVRRETAAAYLKAAGIAFRPPGGWGRQSPAKPANEVITDSAVAKPASEAVALEAGVCNYRFVRRYLERHPQMPLSLRQVDPLLRQLTLYRDFIENKTNENEHEPD
jgi:hypothetical protein